MLEIRNNQRIFIFAKDLKGRFLFCNESHAEIAGFDSPGQIIGKTDFDVYWKKSAHMCRDSDQMTIDGEPRVNIAERRFSRYDGMFDILISKFKLLDEDDRCIGVVGSYYDIKKHSLRYARHDAINSGKMYVSRADLTPREQQVLEHLLLGKVTKEIAVGLNISPRTVEYFINQLKQKFQCRYKKDIVMMAVQYGLFSFNQ